MARRLTALLVLLVALSVRADDGLRLDWTRHSLRAAWRHYTQIVDGLEVVGGGVIERVDRDGSVHETYRALAAPQPHVPRRMLEASAVANAVPPGVIVDQRMVALNDNGVARPVWRVIVEEKLHEPYAHYVDASTGALLRSEALFSRVQARVFDVNPVAKLNRPDLADQNNAAGAVPDAAYSIVDLDNLQPSGPLAGPYIAITNIDGPSPTPADASQPLLFDRSQPQFEEVNAYFQIDRAQKYLISLGYSGTRRLVNYQLPCDPHALNGQDNSFYLRVVTPGQGQLLFGDGGTDDAEDSDIVLHEFGHAIQDWIAPSTFTGPSSSPPPAIGEGFADYWAFSQTYKATVASGRDAFCIADWDARSGGDNPSENCSYPPGADCLRRVDGTKTMADYIDSDDSGTEHKNGEIWSSALREIFMAMTARLGVDAGKRMADTTILEGTFGVPPNPTYATMGRMLLAADAELNGGANLQVICSAMTTRGILQPSDCSLSPHGELTVIPPNDEGGSIPDNTSAGLTLRAVVTDPRSIDLLYVDVDIQHTSRGDLQLQIVGPDGTSAFLKQPSLDRAPNVRATFGLDAPTVTPLDVFHGKPAAGEWKLIVQDLRPRDSGSVRSWSLRIRFAGDTPSSVRPSSLAPRLFLPAVAHATGANGTDYVTDVYLFNRGNQSQTASLVFTPSGQDGWSSFAAVNVELAPQQAVTLSDIVGHTMETTGTGNLDIVGDPNALIVTSRTYTTAPSGGTYGQSIPSVKTDDAAGGGDPALFEELPALRSDADYRTNLGFSEVSGSGGAVRATFYDALGAQLGQNDWTIVPFQHTQTLVTFPGLARAALQVLSGEARIVGYASVVDNHSGDAVYISGIPHNRVVAEPPVVFSLVLPVIHSAGVNGTEWRTDLTIANVSGGPRQVAVRLEPNGPAPVQTVAAGQTLRLDDVLPSLGGASGLAVVSLDGAFSVFYASRTWTAGGNGSYGVGIDPVAQGIGAGPFQDAVIAHVENSAAFRTNIGLLETNNAAVTARILVYGPAGNELGRQDVTLAAHGVTQVPLTGIVAGPLFGGRVTVQAVGGIGRVYAYGSIVDNTTGDPVYIKGQ